MKLTAVRPQRLMSSNIVPCKSSCTILRYTKWYSNCIMLTLHQTCTICFFYRHDDEYASTRGTMKETKFLVFFSALMELLASCSKCLAPCSLSTTVIGTFLSVKQLCTSCGHLRTWNSQPCIGKGALPTGNLLLPFSTQEHLQHKYYVYWSSYPFPPSHSERFSDTSPTISCHRHQECGKRRQHSLQRLRTEACH